MNFLVGILLFFTLLNTILLIVIGAFLVKFRERVNGLFSNFIDVQEELMLPVPSVEAQERKKTWDEKYEEELDALARRMRAESGLKDLPDPVATWGEPPAPNPDNQEGLRTV
jgi:hypothetical protein